MASIETPRFFVAKPNKDGSQRFYWQPPSYTGAKAQALGRDFPAALDLAQQLNDQLDRGQQPAANKGAITIGRAFAAFFRRDAQRDRAGLAPNTLRQYRQVQRLAVAIGAKDRRLDAGPGAWLTHALDDRPALLAATLRVLRLLARRNGIAAWDRPGIAYRRAVDPTPWSDDLVRAFMAAADALGRPSAGLALALNHWLGQRPVDVLALTRAQLTRDRISGHIFLAIDQQKTGARVELPLSPFLIRLLAKARERDKALADRLGRPYCTALIVSEETGRAYTPDAFRRVFRMIRDRAAAGDVTLGEVRLAAVPALAAMRFGWCRHTSETELLEADATIAGVAAWSGHSQASAARMADTYTIRRRRLAAKAGALRLAGSALHRGEE